MNLFENVLDLFDHEDEMIANRAEMVKEYSEKLHKGEILIDEYEELMGDILDMELISEDLGSLDRKVEIKKSIDRLIQVVKVVKSVV